MHYHPPDILNLYPICDNNPFTFSLTSPWISISPFFADPPTPHFDLSVLPKSDKSSSEPTKPVIRVTFFPFLCFLSFISPIHISAKKRFLKFKRPRKS